MKKLSSASAVLTLMLALTSKATMASEADNFLGRELPLRDSLPVVDAKVNAWIDEAVAHANRQAGCNRVRLIHAVQNRIGGHILAALENWADDARELDRFRPPFAQSIYGGKPLLSGIFSRIVTTNIRLNGVYIGVDKLGHFVNQGLGYYKSARAQGRIGDGLKRGEKLENGIFGIITTGVRSYGDLSANYAGYRFWANLSEGESPLVTCENGRFRKAREFTFKDYVDEAWDEAINCSEYIAPIGRSVEAALAKLDAKCPIDEDACRRIRTRPYAERLISGRCRNLDSGSGDGSPKQEIADRGPLAPGPVASAQGSL